METPVSSMCPEFQEKNFDELRAFKFLLQNICKCETETRVQALS
jgi:hypothetical protein